MYCTVRATAGKIANAIAVPDASVLRDDNNQPFVYVAIGANQFGRRDVETGESEDSLRDPESRPYPRNSRFTKTG